MHDGFVDDFLKDLLRNSFKLTLGLNTSPSPVPLSMPEKVDLGHEQCRSQAPRQPIARKHMFERQTHVSYGHTTMSLGKRNKFT